MPLNPRQRAFVREYLKDKNATRAYIAAGYGRKGAQQSSSRLLSNAVVKEAVARGLAKQEAKLELSAEKVLARLSEFAFVPLTQKELKSSAGMNSIRATEILAKHFKLLTDVHELSGKDGQPLVVLTMPANGSEAQTSSSPTDEAPPAPPGEGDEKPQA